MLLVKKILVLLAIVTGLSGCSSEESAPATGGTTTPPPSVPLTGVPETVEVEPNDFTAQANPLTLVENAAIITGSIDSDRLNRGLDNEDFFSFTLGTEETLTFNLVSTDPVENDIDLYVVDASGVNTASDTSRGGLPQISNQTLAAGVIWYVKVFAYATDAPVPYTLTITPSP